MRAATLALCGGGSPTPHELAALLASAMTILDEEAEALRRSADLTPAPYRSRWRTAARRDGLRRPIGTARR